MMMQSDQYEKKWHFDSDGNQVYTMSRKRNPMTDCFRKKRASLSWREGIIKLRKKVVGHGLLWGRSDGFDGISSCRKHCCTRRTAPGSVPRQLTITLVSSGILFPNSGDMWRCGRCENPDWDGDVGLDSVEEGDRESVEDRLRQVIESPLWALVRDFLTSEDVLCMRTTGMKWDIARLYGLSQNYSSSS